MTREQASKPAAPDGASSFSFGLGRAAEVPKFSLGMKEPKKPAIAAVTLITGSKPNFSFADAASTHAQEEPTTAVVQTQKAAGFGASATGSKFNFGGASLFGGSNKSTSSFAQKKEETPSPATVSPSSFMFKPASSPAPAPGKSMFGGSAVSTASPTVEKEEEAKETSATNKLSSLIQNLEEEAYTRYLQQCLLETNRALERFRREEKRLRALIREQKKKLKRL